MAGAEEKAGIGPPEREEGLSLGENRRGGNGSGCWVGKYRLLAELGRGGMASVYLAISRGIGGVNKLVVLKAVLPELASDPSSLAMFMDEARLAAQLNHPNVVQTYEVGTEGGRYVIVMEYLEGQTLGNVVQAAQKAKRPLELALYLRVLIGALEGLHYAHELAAYDGTPLRLVHRDVSPQNIFVTYRGQVKVLDFGIAKAASSSTHTETGIVKGKLAYMAPEQMVGDKVDARADIYSVGCILWALATGRKLWKDVQDVQIMTRVVNGDIPTPRSVNPECDERLERIVMKALAPDPERRYQTAQALAEELEHYVESLGRPSSQKALGAMVSTLFATQRAEYARLVERRLARALKEDNGDLSHSRKELRGSQAARDAERNLLDSKPRALVASGSDKDLGQDGGSVRDLNVAAGLQRRKRRSLSWVAFPLIALFGAGAYLASKLRPSVAPALVAASVSSTPRAPELVERATITLRAEPSGAKLFLDDEELPSNPMVKVMEVDSEIHSLRAEAPGYLASSAEFTVRHDDTVALSLTKAEEPASVVPPPSASAASTPGAWSKGRVTKSRAVRLATPQPVSEVRHEKPTRCAQPFFVDSDGIKRIRPECL